MTDTPSMTRPDNPAAAFDGIKAFGPDSQNSAWLDETGVGRVNYSPGMTLRDWFAGQAVSAYAKYGPNGHAPADMVARACYELADAMLSAREQAA